MTRTHLVTGEPTENPEPRLTYEDGGAAIWHGDCVEVMSQLGADSIDAVITDPPYGLEFMGKGWDTFKASGTAQARVAEGTDSSHPFRDGSTRIRYGRSDLRAFEDWCESWAEQAYRVLKPGGHLLAFGGSRTWHRLTSGIENAGFEIRDSIAWVYGSGFPKSRDVTEAVEKYLADGPADPGLGIREGVYDVTRFLRAARDAGGWTNRMIDELFNTNGMAGHWTSQAQQPAVPSVRQWAELKVVLGFDDSMDELVERLASVERPEDWGAGSADETFLGALVNDPDAPPAGDYGTALKPAFEPIAVGRKPFPGSVDRNVLQYGTAALNLGATRVGDGSDSRARVGEASQDRRYTELGGTDFAAAPGVRGGGETGRWPTNLLLGHSPDCGEHCAPGCPVPMFGDSAKFFPTFRYEPKAPTSERPAVIDEQGNTIQHPTVKPLDLMRWLVRLVVPGGGRVLEPFAGSGTTVEACIIEGVPCTAIELGAEHLPLIEKRIRKDHQQTLFGDLA